MAEAGNWKDLGFLETAPNDEVVKYLGKENDGVTVAVGILKQIAAFNDDQWDSDEVWSSLQPINADSLAQGCQIITGEITKPAKRPVKRTEG